MHEGRQHTATMTALLGHLMELEFTPEYKSWNNQTTPQLFQAPIVKKVREDMRQLEKNLQTLARSCDMLVIWTDCDR
jgi:DNA topoisomerase-3